jgi:translation initiation factor 1A
MGKKLVKNESDIRKKMFMPNRYDILGVVDKNYGFTRMRVICQDGFKRMCRVRGKMKKRNWVREGDIVLISPWDFEYEAPWDFEYEGKGDIIFRYTQNQARWLREAGLLKMG